MASFSQESLSCHSRKELQALAKLHAIKANKSNAEIIMCLLSLPQDDSITATSVIAAQEPLIEAIDTSISDGYIEVKESLAHCEVKSGGEATAPSQSFDDINRQSAVPGTAVQAYLRNLWWNATILKINPKTYKIKLTVCGTQLLVKHGDVQFSILTLGSDLSYKSAATSAIDSVCVSAVDLVSQEVNLTEVAGKRKRNSTEVIPTAIPEVAVDTVALSPLKRKRSNGSIAQTDLPPWNSNKKVQQRESFEGLVVRKKSIGGKPSESSDPKKIDKKSVKARLSIRETLIGKQVRPVTGKVERSSVSSSSTVAPVVASSETISKKLMMFKEDLRESMRRFEANSGIPVICSSGSAKLSKTINSEKASTPAVVAPSPQLSTPSKSKNGVPDFQKMHQRMMSNLKPITAIVKKNEAVGLKMSTAMAEAHKSTPSTTFATHSGHSSNKHIRAPIKPVASSETKSVNSETSTFKARTMPNFKILHSKIPSKTTETPQGDKENSSVASNRAVVSKKRESIKGAKSTMLAAKSTDRRETFMKQKVTIREKAIATSRRSGPFSTNSAGK